VNPLAKEEYDAEKARLEELAVQRKDLEQSLAELEKLRAELTETVERRFAETFDAVERNFAEVAETLFPGGEGRLRLTISDDEEELPGIEVELRPAGAQFVVITHQKRTMEAADVLYGVTMGGDGISQIVSRRLPREEAEAVSGVAGHVLATRLRPNSLPPPNPLSVCA
jgi:chromosome segregation ATPase